MTISENFIFKLTYKAKLLTASSQLPLHGEEQPVSLFHQTPIVLTAEFCRYYTNQKVVLLKN